MQEDVQLHVMDTREIEAATRSLLNGVVTVIRSHRGFVREALPCGQHPWCALVKIRHTDESNCNCKEQH